MRLVDLTRFSIGKKRDPQGYLASSLVCILGPCVIEDEALLLETASFLKDLCASLDLPLIFKSSYDKANRSALHSFRGPGLKKGLSLLKKVSTTFDLPILTDVHTPEEAKRAAEVCDVLQIPAFLCRQTDLLVAAAETGRVINVKKGQFMSPSDMKNVVEKIVLSGNSNVFLTDRGVSFGYHNLVSDFRAIPIMQQWAPVCFDATHSVQLPGGETTSSGGQVEFVPTLAKAAIASGADAIYIETHPNPLEAKSDRKTQLDFTKLKALLPILKDLYHIVNKDPSSLTEKEPAPSKAIRCQGGV